MIILSARPWIALYDKLTDIDPDIDTSNWHTCFRDKFKFTFDEQWIGNGIRRQYQLNFETEADKLWFILRYM